MAFACVTLLGVLALGVLDGVLIGVLASMVGLVSALNRPDIAVLGRRPGRGTWRDLALYPDGETTPGTMVVRVGGPVYFANVAGVHAHLLQLVDAGPARPRVLVLDLVAVPDIDVTALLRLPAIDRDLHDREVTLRLANPDRQLLALLRPAPDQGGLAERTFGGVNEAVAGRPS